MFLLLFFSLAWNALCIRIYALQCWKFHFFELLIARWELLLTAIWKRTRKKFIGWKNWLRVIRTSRHFLCCSHSLNVVIKDWKFIEIVWLFLVLRLQTVDYYWLSQRKEKTMANQNKINYRMSHWVIEAKPVKVRQPRVSIILHLIG